jgi:iron complex outermembrane receptor protein
MASSIGIRSFTRYCRAALLAGFAIMPAISAPVFAADTADTPAPDETIIVTGVHAQTDVGTKTDTPLIETPQSISIVPADRFTDFGALNLGETLRYSAGVRSEAYGLDTRSDDAFVRGTEPTIYQDGMRRLYGGYRTGSKQEVYNLDRVEVLRGPSSMLYGQAPTGGLINTVSKQPQFDTHFDAFASYGTWDRKEVGADVTGPIVGDTLAGRIDGVFRDTDTQVRGVGERRWSIQPGLTWKPDSRTELTLIGLFQRDRGGWTSQFVPYVLQLRGQDAPNGQLGFRTNLSNRGDHVNLDTENVTAIFSHRFSDHIRFRSSARYEWFKSDQTLTYPDSYSNPTDPFVAANDPYLLQFFPDYAAKGDGRILNRYAFAEVFHSKTLTTDNQLQFDFATGPAVHKLLVGVDYARYSARTLSAYGGSFNGYDEDGDPIPPDAYPIDAYDPVSRPSTLTLSREPDARETQLGFYAQDQIKLWDRLTVLGGFRHDRATSRSTGSPGSVEQAWTGRVALLYDIGRGLVPYVSWSESFQPVVGNDFYGKSYNPTRGRQYEAGVKWQPDAATFITADIYDLHDTGRLVNDPANPLNSIQAGLIRTRGFEIEAQRTVADDLDLIASYAYTRAKDSAIDVGGRVTINQVESSPKQLASVWVMKRVALSDTWKLRGGAGVRYVGPSWSTSFDDAGNFTLKTPGYVAVDALAGVAWNRWHADLNVTNLFNKHYYSSCLGRGDCFIGLLRTVNLRVGYSF